MSNGGQLLILNGTPYDMWVTFQHRYQMQWGPPLVIPALGKGSFYVEWEGDPLNGSYNYWDSAAEVCYRFREANEGAWTQLVLKLFAKQFYDGPLGSNIYYHAQSPEGGDMTAGLPYYVCDNSFLPQWRLLDSGISPPVGFAHDATVCFRIAQVDQFCASADDVTAVVAAIQSGNLNSDAYRAFAQSAETCFDTMTGIQTTPP